MHRGTMGSDPSGWIAGRWNWDLPIAIGYATEGIDEPHRHGEQVEIYLVARGTAEAVVDGAEVSLAAGDVLVVEPQEIRTFTSSSKDYRCFVLHVGGDDASDKEIVRG